MLKLWSALPNGLNRFLTAAYFRVQKLRTVGLRSLHSCVSNLEMGDIQISILPALQDNYMYLIIDLVSRDAAVVDPVEPDAVLRVVQQEKCKLKKILTTHHHWDHSGGNANLVNKCKDLNLSVYGGDERIDCLTQRVNEGDVFNVGGLTVKCILTPCHTSGHVCYFVQSSSGENVVFTGDTLFQAGCGRFFEGTAEQMYDALYNKLGNLPNDTKVFCGHEYTLQNLLFAKTVEPQNENILKHIEWAKKLRASKTPTVPSTIADEKLINPFMRIHEVTVQNFANETDPIKTMAMLRQKKDHFKT